MTEKVGWKRSLLQKIWLLLGIFLPLVLPIPGFICLGLLVFGLTVISNEVFLYLYLVLILNLILQTFFQLRKGKTFELYFLMGLACCDILLSLWMLFHSETGWPAVVLVVIFDLMFIRTLVLAKQDKLQLDITYSLIDRSRLLGAVTLVLSVLSALSVLVNALLPYWTLPFSLFITNSTGLLAQQPENGLIFFFILMVASILGLSPFRFKRGSNLLTKLSCGIFLTDLVVSLLVHAYGSSEMFEGLGKPQLIHMGTDALMGLLLLMWLCGGKVVQKWQDIEASE